MLGYRPLQGDGCRLREEGGIPDTLRVGWNHGPATNERDHLRGENAGACLRIVRDFRPAVRWVCQPLGHYVSLVD